MINLWRSAPYLFPPGVLRGGREGTSAVEVREQEQMQQEAWYSLENTRKGPKVL